MNNPFYYSPSPDCLAAAKELTDWLEGKPSPFSDTRVDESFKKEIDKGKMFGVLCVREKRKSEKVYWQMTFGVIGFGMIIMSKGI